MKQKILTVLFFTLASLNGQAQNTPNSLTEIWREGNVFYPIVRDAETKALISLKCAESKSTCQALKAVKNPKKTRFHADELTGGKNPTSLLCSKSFKGEVLILKDAHGNENSFCKFPDLTLVNANDLR